MFRCWKLVGLLLAVAPWVVLASHPAPAVPPPDPALLAIWRKPDNQGRACVSCHSPDGIEIAAYAFPDEDIVRRAQSHVSEPDAKQIVEMIHEVRRNYHIDKLLDPMRDRPMQPGGELLAGSTPMERDGSFARELQAVVPLFFARRIDSLAEAIAARDQLLAVDLSNLKVGIPINRLSEDVFHGPEHATIADWLGDVPLAKELPASLQDAYLADPSSANFQALDHALNAMYAQQGTLAQMCAWIKRRSLLYFQHSLRTRFLKTAEPVKLEGLNPMWSLGEFGRMSQNVNITAMGMPADVASKKLTGPSSADQMRELRLSWYWLGWCMDPGLQRTGPLTETFRADYFTRFLWSDGPYPMHQAFMVTRKIATESFVPSAWNSGAPQHLDLNYSAFLNDGGVGGPLPPDPQDRALFDAFVANSFRMNLFLQIDELSRTKTVYLREALNQQIKRMKQIFKDPRDQTLADRTLALIAQCKSAGR